MAAGSKRHRGLCPYCEFRPDLALRRPGAADSLLTQGRGQKVFGWQAGGTAT